MVLLIDTEAQGYRPHAEQNHILLSASVIAYREILYLSPMGWHTANQTLRQAQDSISLTSINMGNNAQQFNNEDLSLG